MVRVDYPLLRISLSRLDYLLFTISLFRISKGVHKAALFVEQLSVLGCMLSYSVVAYVIEISYLKTCHF